MDFFFQMQSLMWNLVSLALFEIWSWNAFWKIYSLCLISKHEFWWRVLNCFGCLWYRCLFIYIYVIIIVSYRFYCLLLNDLTVEIYLLHDILIIKDKIFTYSYSLLLQVLFYSMFPLLIHQLLSAGHFKYSGNKIDFPS